MLNERATRGVLGVHQILGGSAQTLGIAEAMAPAAGDAVTVGMDKNPELMTELHICQECYMMKSINLALLCER
jgi:hypothetical protein